MTGSRIVSEQRTGVPASEIQPRFRLDVLMWLMLGAALVISVLARRYVVGVKSVDFGYYLEHWYGHLRAEGYHGFRTAFADYNFPYLYMLYAASLFKVSALVAVKSISIFFDYVMGFAIWWLVKGISPSSRYLPMFAALTVLCMPTVMLNSAAWGQAEAIYVSFVVLTLGFWVRGRFNWAWFIFGVAFSIKLQAIFLLPLLAVLWLIDRRQKLWAPLMFLIVPVLAPIPAIVWGRPVKAAYGVYVDQAEVYFNSRTSNLMWWLRNAPSSVGSMMTAVTMAALLLTVAGFLLRHKGRPNFHSIVAMAAFISLMVPFLLPTMRDRYFYCGEILTLVWAFIAPKKRAWLPLLVSVPVLMLYSLNLFHTSRELSFTVLSLPLLAAIVILGLDAYCVADSAGDGCSATDSSTPPAEDA